MPEYFKVKPACRSAKALFKILRFLGLGGLKPWLPGMFSQNLAKNQSDTLWPVLRCMSPVHSRVETSIWAQTQDFWLWCQHATTELSPWCVLQGCAEPLKIRSKPFLPIGFPVAPWKSQLCDLKCKPETKILTLPEYEWVIKIETLKKEVQENWGSSHILLSKTPIYEARMWSCRKSAVQNFLLILGQAKCIFQEVLRQLPQNLNFLLPKTFSGSDP